MAYNNTPRKLATDPMASEAKGEGHKMSSLNNQLAQYIQQVREMRVASARALGKTHYFETLERMEGELIKIRGAYEAEMNRMRQALQETNNRNIALSQALQQDRQRLNDSQRRLVEDDDMLKKAKGTQGNMRTVLTQRDAELMRLREELRSREEELRSVKTKNDDLLRNMDNTLKRLEIEASQRLEAEKNASQLHENTNFQKKLHGQKEADLQERIKTANSIIQSLDNKLRELAELTQDQLPQMLNRLRDMNNAEMKEFHEQTEKSLGKTITALKRQIAQEQKVKHQTKQERDSLQNVALAHKEKDKEKNAQIQALRDQVQALRQELDNERTRSQQLLAEQEMDINQLEDELMKKAAEFVHAREAQAKLKAEIDTYRSLLDEENQRMRAGYKPEARPPPRREPISSMTPPPPTASKKPSTNYNDSYRKESKSVPPRPPAVEYSNKLPPINHRANQIMWYGAPQPDPRTALPANGQFDTTYSRSFTPKPHKRYGRP